MTKSSAGQDRDNRLYFVIRASSFFRHSCFVIRHYGRRSSAVGLGLLFPIRSGRSPMQTMPERAATQPALSSGRRWMGARRLGSRRTLLFGCLSGVLVAAGAEAYGVFLGSNFHMVIPGRVYRSAQLSAPELEQTLSAKGIRTVVNLRGSCDPCPWYLDESRATRQRNVCQEDICFSAGHLPSV